jgi:hypothetical protein
MHCLSCERLDYIDVELGIVLEDRSAVWIRFASGLP